MATVYDPNNQHPFRTWLKNELDKDSEDDSILGFIPPIFVGILICLIGWATHWK
jgi:hypothetical protein